MSRLIFTTMTIVCLAVFTSAANAGVVVDDFASATPSNTNSTVSISVVGGATATNGHTFSRIGDGNVGYRFSSAATTPTQTVRINYAFDKGVGGINQYFTPPESGEVKFFVPYWRTAGVGTFTVQTFITDNSGTSSVLTTMLIAGANPNNQTEAYEINTGRTVDSLASNDITAIRFDISFSGSGGAGLVNTLNFGGIGNGASNGTIAAVPEPTSVLMFGTAVAGLIVRRRRK